MDVQEKKAFEIAFDNKLGARGCQFDLDEDGNYEDRETLCGWHMWLEAKTQAVPKDSVTVSKWTLALALNSIENNEDNEGIIEDLQELIHKAQEPAND